MAKGWISSSHFLLLSLVLLMLAAMQLAEATDSPAVPAIFILGDSTADVGTNDYLPESRARADFLFNGIDFPNSVPTGRFSNGFNSADQIVRLLGYKMSPPSFFQLVSRPSSFRKNILRGVNFASGGSGLGGDTGHLQFNKVISMGEQIQQFATVQSNITATLGESATCMLAKSLFIISAGSNDIFEYALSNSTLSKPDFITTLQSLYTNHLQNLFKLGARKFGIISIPPLGCCPSQRISESECLEKLNDLARTFHAALVALLQNLSSELTEMKYALGNVYEMTMDIIDNPRAFSIKEVKTACCGGGSFNGKLPCNQSAKLCVDRDDYLFWDRFHPTQAASKLAALTFYWGEQRFVAPMNFSMLAKLDV